MKVYGALYTSVVLNIMFFGQPSDHLPYSYVLKSITNFQPNFFLITTLIMITYELMLLLRSLPKPELHTVLKRTANCIFEQGGIIRKLENLGSKSTPYKTSSHDHVHNKAEYFLFEFTVPPSTIDTLLDEYRRDVDIIRRRIFKKNIYEPFECTLDDEIQPPPYRKDVQELIEQSRKLDKPKFKHNTGLDYYPFQK